MHSFSCIGCTFRVCGLCGLVACVRKTSLWSKGSENTATHRARMSHLHPGIADADSHGMPLHHSAFYKYGETSYPPMASDMVAPAKIQEPWTIDQRLPTTRPSTHNGGHHFGMTSYYGVPRVTLPPLVTRWKPRSGTGYAAWASDIKDRITTCDLLDTSCCRAPTLDDMIVP